MEKEIGITKTFICMNLNCATTEFRGKYDRGFGGFARPPQCPDCGRSSEYIKNIGSLKKAKTKGHPNYA